ncbi:MAG: single-stranded-DNA-specific exonuclease RecJ [Thermoanaerobaculia bacterium]|nr:single-stranded-DNA-specific exonuclease RecJ [Thermoanaerobaculia bacterium]
MSAAPAEWVEAERPSAAATLEREGLPAWQAAVLARRGVSTPDEARAFLEPSVDQLHDPLLLEGMAAAVARLVAAREAGERVALVGDYDVDGISATALLTAVFTALGLDTEPILPHRLTEGYGFQEVHVERAARAGCSLVVTADCGTSSHDAIAAAATAGIEVIVTDHHLLRGEPPHPAILINPQQPGCSYPFAELCGAGLAFKLATAFARACGRPLDPHRLLRIACLGTICDLVPLTGENRVIAALGLAALPDTRSAGVRALLALSGVTAPVGAGDVGFRIGPRINAAGRMAEPEPALELLLARDPLRATALAERLDAWNRERREAETAVVEEARERILAAPELPRFLAEWSPSWHKGVLGIAAGRLAKEFHRPAVLLQVEGDRATGSGRSIPGVHLFDFLSGWRDRYERYGGHAQAIGLSVPAASLGELRREWLEAAAEWDPDLLRRRFRYDARLDAAAIDFPLLEQVQRLAPFGIGNPRPLFRLGPLEPAAPPRRFGQGHGALRALAGDGVSVELSGWGWGDRLEEIAGPFEVLGRVELDRYLGRPIVRLVDARPSGSGPPTG